MGGNDIDIFVDDANDTFAREVAMDDTPIIICSWHGGGRAAKVSYRK